MEGKSVKSGMSVYELDLCCAGQGEAPKVEVEVGKEKGVYVCSCCGSRLFSTGAEYPYNEKYPRIPEVLEFVGVLAKESVAFVDENAYGIERVSFACQKCGLNLGFVASREDAGIVYCANPSCLRFVAEEEDLAKLNEERVKMWTPAVSIIEEVVEEVEEEKKEEVEKKKEDAEVKDVKEEEKKPKGEKRVKRKRKEKDEEEEDDESSVSFPKVAAAFAGLLSVIGWAGYTTYK